jgi:hypothetical protein
MKILSTTLLAAGLLSLTACGGGAANNTASNTATNELPPIENVADANALPPLDANAPATAPVDANAAGNAVDANAAGNAH